MMGLDDGPLPPHLHPHHRHGHHGRRLHAECDFYLPQRGHHGGHPQVIDPVHRETVGPPRPITSPPAPRPLMGTQGGIFSTDD